MKLKAILLTIFLGTIIQPVTAQSINNIYEDVIALRQLCKPNPAGNPVLSADDRDEWRKILNKYISAEDQSDESSFLSAFSDNPYNLKPGGLLPATLPKRDTSSGLNEVIVIGTSRTQSLRGLISSTNAAPFGTAQFADAITQLVIERGKQELTATFFDQMKKQLMLNPELRAAFPKTTEFIDQIESYLYATYLTTLREAFLEDINNLPFNIGVILRSERMKAYMLKNPKSGNVWLAIPVLSFLGDLHRQKSIADAIKDLDPDPELQNVNRRYYNLLKLTTILSESIRDKSSDADWISPAVFKVNILDDVVSKSLFMGLLYQSAEPYTELSDYIESNEVKVETFLNSMSTSFTGLKAAMDEIKKQVSETGQPVKVEQILKIINTSSSALQATIDRVNTLAPANAQQLIDTKLFFETIPQITTIVGNFNNKKFGSGVMNSLVLMNRFIATGEVKLVPFEKKTFLDPESSGSANAEAFIAEAIKQIKLYAGKYPNDKEIVAFVPELEKWIKGVNGEPTEKQEEAIEKILEKISSHTYSFDANLIYQKLLKYSSMMAALAEAKTTQDITEALDAAILPVGSSSIKYYTSSSLSLNTYIGASYYSEYYRPVGGNGSFSLPTAGVALPIGINYSISTRWAVLGSVSLFISALDLGALASFRLSAPKEVNSEDLPEFKFQNILAPGAFIVLGRLFKTPLAIGFGAQKGPQLRKVTTGVAEISANPAWRFGGFLTVDIPLFNLYSKSLRRPLK